MSRRTSHTGRTKTTLIDTYLNYQQEYQKKYGINTVVLMEVGSFFEVYGVDNKKEKIGNVARIASLFNIQKTRKNKSILENNRKNPQMCGFPSPCLHRYVNVLLDVGYTIVLVEQVTPPPNPKREVTKIYSPGTYIEETTGTYSNTVVYIGQTIQKPRKRFKAHLHNSSNPNTGDYATLNSQWIRSLKSDGLKPKLHILTTLRNTHQSELDACEAYWYGYFKQVGCSLTNMVPAGQGEGRRMGRKLSAETKRKMSKARLGRRLSKSTREKIGDAHRGKETSEETKKKISRTMTSPYCKKGHSLNESNIVLYTDGRRRCRACNNERSKLFKRKKRAALRQIAKNPEGVGN